MKPRSVAMLVRNSVSHDARVLKQAKALANENYNVTIIGVCDKNQNKAVEILNKIKVIRIDQAAHSKSKKSRIKILALAFKIKKALIFKIKNIKPLKLKSYIKNERTFKLKSYGILKKIKPDILHCHDLNTLSTGVFYKLKNKCKLIYDAHEMYLESAVISHTPLLKKYLHFHQKRLSKHVDCFITINDSISNYYARNYIHFSNPEVITNASELCLNEIEYDGRLHKAANIKLDKKILLYQGGVTQPRGLEYIVNAAAMLNQKWHMVIMGSGPYLTTLQKICEPFSNRISFIPPTPREELLLWTQGATIGMIPYLNTCLNHFFCTPNKLWEYPTANVPILASPLAELSHHINHNKIGWTLPQSMNHNDIASFINNLTKEDILKKKLNCKEFIVKNGWDTERRKLLKLYERLS